MSEISDITETYVTDYSNVSIIIPAYNEEDGIVATLNSLREYFPAAEIIVVDDGIAAGSTLRVAVQALHNTGAGEIIVAVPTAHDA